MGSSDHEVILTYFVPVHKKGSRSEAKNNRSICLLFVGSKVLEEIIAERLTSQLDSQHLLSPRQFGFRMGRSAADLNLLLTNDWSNALDQGRRTAILALNIAGAFDRVARNRREWRLAGAAEGLPG
ncbi:uncharacterized protein LOC135096332 [Scylla paramamosain]|uniref:uncharacterized protein LOC135096332 n=1 Tax=Scylla paramamosain TaxID=85552 RepID=UPI0030839E15